MASRQKPLLRLSLRCILSHNAPVPFTGPAIREWPHQLNTPEGSTAWIARLRLPSNPGRNRRRSGNFQSAFASSHAPALLPHAPPQLKISNGCWMYTSALGPGRGSQVETETRQRRFMPKMAIHVKDQQLQKKKNSHCFLMLLIINYLSYTCLFQITYRERQVICPSESLGWSKLLNGDLLTPSADSQPGLWDKRANTDNISPHLWLNTPWIFKINGSAGGRNSFRGGDKKLLIVHRVLATVFLIVANKRACRWCRSSAASVQQAPSQTLAPM